MREIELVNGRGIALVDECDYERVAAFRWCLNGSGYAIRSGQERQLMHRFILRAPVDVHIDHKNHNRLDNRRSNIRFATRSQNCGNAHGRHLTSQFKGVHRKRNVWQAQIGVAGTTVRLGSFASEIEAALAYDVAAAAHYGEFALLNFPLPAIVWTRDAIVLPNEPQPASAA